MSTISKLDPRIRRDRAARREMLRSLARNALLLQSAPPFLGQQNALAIYRTTLDVLDGIRKRPGITGASKNELFTRVARELTARQQGGEDG